VNPWFDALGDRFAKAATRRDAQIEPPQLDAAVADEILELAGVTAHTQERRFAPLASYLAGIAVERLRAAGRLAAPDDVAAYLREVRSSLEIEPRA
jgi:uncharacterized protein DUF6457